MKLHAPQNAASFPKALWMNTKGPPTWGSILVNSPYTRPMGIHSSPVIPKARAIDGPDSDIHHCVHHYQSRSISSTFSFIEISFSLSINVRYQWSVSAVSLTGWTPCPSKLQQNLPKRTASACCSESIVINTNILAYRMKRQCCNELDEKIISVKLLTEKLLRT